MDAIKYPIIKLFRSLFLLILGMSTSLKVFAKSSVSMLLNSWYQQGQGGKQVYDASGKEDLFVIEPALFVSTSIGSHTNLSLHALFDAWSGASDQIFNSATSASSKAPVNSATDSEGSGEREEGEGGSNLQSRKAIGANIGYKNGAWESAVSGGLSSEADYVSYNGGISLSRSFAQENFVVSANYQRFSDFVYLYDMEQGIFTTWTPKTTDSYNFSISQLLGKTDVLLLGVGLTTQNGSLRTEMNTVASLYEGNIIRMQESLPNTRQRKYAIARLMHGFNDVISSGLDYRYYTDTFGIKANTLEPTLSFDLDDDAGFIRFAYRYHEQGPSTYFVQQANKSMQYFTSDSDLEGFVSKEISMFGSHTFEVASEVISGSFEAGMGLSYYSRSNNLSGVAIQGSLGSFF